MGSVETDIPLSLATTLAVEGEVLPGTSSDLVRLSFCVGVFLLATVWRIVSGGVLIVCRDCGEGCGEGCTIVETMGLLFGFRAFVFHGDTTSGVACGFSIGIPNC